jgi:hypothetical protein
MIACRGRLAAAILGISFAVQAACSIEAAAQEAGTGSPNGYQCVKNSPISRVRRVRWDVV